MLRRFAKVASVVGLAAAAGVLFGLAPRLVRAERRDAAKAAAVPGGARNYRHSICPDGVPTRIYSPAPGLLRIAGAYDVTPLGHRSETMAVRLEVTDLATGEEVYGQELGRWHHGPKGSGTYPLRLDLPLLPGEYGVFLYVHDTERELEDLDGSRSAYSPSGIRARVSVQ